MKPAPFAYHAPETTADAVAILREHGDEAKALAGGQSLVPLLALRLTRFGHLVDLNRIPELQGFRRDDGTLEVGAMTRQATVEHWKEPGREGVVAYVDGDRRPRGFLLWNVWGKVDAARELIRAGKPADESTVQELAG